MRNSFTTLQVLIAALLLLAACSAERVTLSPEIDGVLVVNGRAASNADVLVGFSGDHNVPCKSLKPAAQTAENGEFHVAATTRRASDRPANPVIPTENYICFRYRGKLIVGNLILIMPEHTKYFAECRVPVPQGATAEDSLVCTLRTANNSFKPKPLRGSA